MSGLGLPELMILLVYLVPLAALYFVVRLAVRHGMRDARREERREERR